MASRRRHTHSAGKPTRPGAPRTGEELLAVMSTFLEGQQSKRGEGFLAELKGLQALITPLQPGAEQRPMESILTPTRVTLPSNLPTPATPPPAALQFTPGGVEVQCEWWSCTSLA